MGQDIDTLVTSWPRIVQIIRRTRDEIKYETGQSQRIRARGAQPTIEMRAAITMSTSAACPRRSHDLRCRSNRYNYDLSIKQTYDKHATRKSYREIAISTNLHVTATF